jgi:hypothetical protein
MLTMICRIGGGYLVYEFASSVLLAVTAWGLGFSGF